MVTSNTKRYLSRIPQPQFVFAILLVNGRYLLQLRDDKSGISFPGIWSLFGGKVEEGEEPLRAIIREVEEELCIKLYKCQLLWNDEYFHDFMAITAKYWLFEADITEQWKYHHLMEGQAAKHFAFKELYKLEIPSLIREIIERHYYGKAQ